MVISPNGKELAFLVRGEIFVTSVEGGITKRITNTPQQERSVSFTPDGRSLVYAAERANSWDIFETSIVRSQEKYFYASTVLKEEPLIATAAEEFQPVLSPDGNEIAYLEERNVLKVFNLANKKGRTIAARLGFQLSTKTVAQRPLGRMAPRSAVWREESQGRGCGRRRLRQSNLRDERARPAAGGA